MRRVACLVVQVYCPHFGRPVAAQQNVATEMLVSCSSQHECVIAEPGPSGEPAPRYPGGCPVHRPRDR